VLHDAAAAGEPPYPAGIADAATVAAPVVAETVVKNYNRCLANTAQLESLQEWVKEQLSAVVHE
jgi:hypothetical protein